MNLTFYDLLEAVQYQQNANLEGRERLALGSSSSGG